MPFFINCDIIMIGDTVMKEQIIDLLKKENKAYTVDELAKMLELNNFKGFEALIKELNVLEDELIIYRTKKDKYMLLSNSNLKIGTMASNKKGFGFVVVNGEEDIYISSENMNEAIHGDKVVVEIISKKGIDFEGRIVKIVERKIKQLVGEFVTIKNKHYLKLDEEKIRLSILIDEKNTLGAVDGHKVLVKIGKKIGKNEYIGQIIKIFGHKDDPGVDVLSIAAKYEIKDEFSKEVEEEVNNILNEVSEKELVGRTDLRSKMIFTIDGSDTKDIDDAISIDILPNNNYLLGVHIADVSYYVRENTKLDAEAYERGTSVYLADRVIPMLPHKLSNGICSLNEGVDRLTVSCDMEINQTGEIVNYNIYESVINSKKKMNYKSVNEILENNKVVEGYEPFIDVLKQMHELSKIVRKYKINRGYIDFEVDEAKIKVNESGEAIDVIKRERGVGENLIEDFMICANETVATHIYNMDLPFVYRVHGVPSKEKMDNFIRFISLFGYKLEGNFNKIRPKDVQKIISQLKDKKEFKSLSSMLLRSMQKAVYDKKNIGHFGLASTCYTHFTSPIRRYPDTTVHRLLRTYLFDKNITSETVKYWDNKLPFLTEHSSYKEQMSVECEREVDDMKMAEYMMKHIGEEFVGTVNGVMNFGMFIILDNLIEGLVRVDSIKNDFYTLDGMSQTLRGKNGNNSYRIGDVVKVKVTNANKENKTIDFELVK